jgi:ATP-dependent Clp protease adaptor protein ClpS
LQNQKLKVKILPRAGKLPLVFSVVNMSSVEIIEQTTTQTLLAQPTRWNVVLHNDDKTAMEFVVLVLMQIFHQSFETASELMLKIHHDGRGIAGTYTHETARQKQEETMFSARSHGYPLVCTIEPTPA